MVLHDRSFKRRIDWGKKEKRITSWDEFLKNLDSWKRWLAWESNRQDLQST